MQIRKLRTPAEFMGAEEIQKKVWHFPDREIAPLNELVVLQKHGGHVFGAFEGGRMVSFCFGCPAYADGKTYHYSRMLGTLPRRQDTGIGYRMKLRQREYVLDQGLDLVMWTFDPLQSRNAYFNLEKLGCVVREYSENLYPGSDSRFNRGLEADRFTAEWWIRSSRVRSRLKGRHSPHSLEGHEPMIDTRVMSGGWREPVSVRTPRGRRLAVEIPGDIDAVKRADLGLAREWRRATRRAFLSCLARGYVVQGFLLKPENGRRRGFYLLEKGLRVP